MKKVAVGLSGGVDSAVAAALLIKAGWTVIGITMKVYREYPGISADAIPAGSCFGPQEHQTIEAAKSVADYLGIKHVVVDISGTFIDTITSYVVDEYMHGRTPNPCVKCNRAIKFGALYREAQRRLGSDILFSTGHYAAIVFDEQRKRYLLKTGRDSAKDQTYFLGFLTQSQLAATLFPLADYTKDEVRKYASKLQLPQAERPESQDFMGGQYRVLFSGHARPGDIVDTSGTVIGRHSGIENYTIGQRKRLPAVGYPIYVLRIDAESNRIVVGKKEELYRSELIAEQCNFIPFDALSDPIRVYAKIRQQHTPAPALLTPIGQKRVSARFEQPQLSVTPGQAVVFYREDEVVGAGIIK